MIRSTGYEATRPRATRVMQYVHRPMQPCSIGMTRRAIRTIATRCPRTVSNPTRHRGVLRSGPLPRGRSLAWGPCPGLAVVAARHAAGDDEGFVVRRQFGHAADHVPLGRLHAVQVTRSGRRHRLRRSRGVTLPCQSFLHEARFPVVLRATMRLDEIFTVGRWTGPYFRLRVRGRNSYARMRVRDDHGAWPSTRTDTADPDADTNARDAAGIPRSAPPGTGTRGSRIAEGRQAPTPGREGAPEGEPSRRAHAHLRSKRPDGNGGRTIWTGSLDPGRRIRQRVICAKAPGRSRFVHRITRAAISFTYCVSRYHPRQDGAVRLLEFAHGSHPAPRCGPSPDKRLSTTREGSCPGTRSTGRWSMPPGIVYDEIENYVDGLANRGDTALVTVESRAEEGWPIVGAAEGSSPHPRAVPASEAYPGARTAIGYSDLARSRPRRRRRTGHVEHDAKTAALAQKISRRPASLRGTGPRGGRGPDPSRPQGAFDFIFNDIDKAGYPRSSSVYRTSPGRRPLGHGQRPLAWRCGRKVRSARRRRSGPTTRGCEGPAYDRDDRAAREGLDRVESRD